ncbi:NUDIX hydrolase [candidate division KSB1 bacterium]|nr:NUDIX hydrolase [candidate division KSB1 bacterium]
MSDNKGRKIYIDETTSLPLNTKSQGIVYEDRYKKIEKITAEFDGFSKEYFVSDFGEKAAVLVFRDNCVLLTRQYRLLINKLSYEVPGGKVNSGENPEDTAIRECFEETGVRCSNLKPLITYDPDLEYTRNHTHVFYTHDTENAKTQLSGKHRWLPFNDCLKMIEQGIITDSLSIITLLAYKVKNRGI